MQNHSTANLSPNGFLKIQAEPCEIEFLIFGGVPKFKFPNEYTTLISQGDYDDLQKLLLNSGEKSDNHDTIIYFLNELKVAIALTDELQKEKWTKIYLQEGIIKYYESITKWLNNPFVFNMYINVYSSFPIGAKSRFEPQYLNPNKHKKLYFQKTPAKVLFNFFYATLKDADKTRNVIVSLYEKINLVSKDLYDPQTYYADKVYEWTDSRNKPKA